MKILTSVTVYNRPTYSSLAISSLKDTDYLIVVDNASEDKVQLRGHHVKDFIQNRQNLFPGAATNIGWQHGLKSFDADLLHRSDNDIEYLPGWKEEVIKLFKAIPRLGQLGVLNCHEDYPNGPPFEEFEENGEKFYFTNPGGNSVLRRSLWDEGVRWAPGQWRPGGNDEDSQMSNVIRSMGYLVGRVIPTIANNISFGRYHDYPEYYQETAALRGLIAETSV